MDPIDEWINSFISIPQSSIFVCNPLKVKIVGKAVEKFEL